jgi:hypothetical protein
MKYIGIDLATKSLAVSIIDYNPDFIREMNQQLDDWIEYKNRYIEWCAESGMEDIETLLIQFNKTLDKITDVLDGRLKILDMSVVDLIPGDKVADVSVVDRTTKLHQYMNTIFDSKLSLYKPQDMTFLLEYQMGPNIKSNLVASQVIYHLAKYRNGDNIVLVGPSLKNKIMIGDREAHYSNFVNRYTTLYAANKNHTKFNLQRLLEFTGDKFPPKGIKKANVDDIADTVMMTMAWLLKN